MFSFKKLRKQLYELRFDNAHEMCMTFLRYQEFYESPRFEGRRFTIAEFMSWYARFQNDSGVFSYPQDWGGFNLPVRIISQVQEMGIDDPNHYDDLMSFIYSIITAECDDAYLIGLEKGGTLDRHEMTHAMFHIDVLYRQHVLYALENVQNDLVKELKAILLDNGYAESTALDEVNAYVTTGDCDFFEAHRETPEYKELQRCLMTLHDTYYPIFIADIKQE